MLLESSFDFHFSLLRRRKEEEKMVPLLRHEIKEGEVFDHVVSPWGLCVKKFGC